ncbi:MAG: hypothetical protein QW808_00900, partial [Desulfurococcaceae archaeon]
KLSREDLLLAMGRLLSVKTTPRSSIHEVVKELRRALELAMKMPLKMSVDEAIVRAIYTSPPFDSDALNSVYRVLLEKLLRDTINRINELGPMWRKRLLNLIVENVYNIAVAQETREYKEKIFEALKEGLEVK